MTAFSSLYTGRLDRELGTDDVVLFTAARRKSAVNEGLREFAELTECFQRTVTVSIVGGSSGVGPLQLPQAEYNLNSTTVIPDGDFVRLSKDGVQFVYTDASSIVTVLSGPDLPQRNVDWLNKYRPGWQDPTLGTTSAQFPECFYLRPDGGGLYLGFWPTPSTGPGASAEAIVPYVALPPPLTSDTQEPFAVAGEYRVDLRAWHQASVHYGAAMLEKLRRDVDASQSQMSQFLNYVARCLASMRVKGGRQIGFARNYWRSSRNDDRGTDPRR